MYVRIDELLQGIGSEFVKAFHDNLVQENKVLENFCIGVETPIVYVLNEGRGAFGLSSLLRESGYAATAECKAPRRGKKIDPFPSMRNASLGLSLACFPFSHQTTQVLIGLLANCLPGGARQALPVATDGILAPRELFIQKGVGEPTRGQTRFLLQSFVESLGSLLHSSFSKIGVEQVDFECGLPGIDGHRPLHL